MRFLISFCAVLLATSVRADAPRVAVDIAPVHGLVSQIMDGVGTPDLIIPLGASPHGYAMRPSEARALSQADIVFWVGPALTPWMEGPMENLGVNATKVELMEAAGVTLLPYREGARFEPHDHGHDHQDDHAAEKEHDHSHDHDHDHAEKDEHADHGDVHGAMDSHVWLDPQNAAVWLDVIAAELSNVDPENAATYAQNAVQARAELEVVTSNISAELSGLEGRPFIVFHDSYHYFEARFGVEAVAAITLGDAGTASAARLAAVRDVVSETGATCALAEPRVSKGLIDAVSESGNIGVTTLDAVGVDIPLGTGFYPSLLMQVFNGITTCLRGK